MTLHHLAPALLFALLAGTVYADIWECVDGSGNKRFTNIKSEAGGCRSLTSGPPNAVPGGKPQARAAPPGFPKVDGNTQKQRDNDRRRILEQELANEQRLLEQARNELAEQDSMRLRADEHHHPGLDN